MNITFLIGNGFDRNLGLDTTYANFVNHYKKSPPKTETLKKFHAYIKENEELWSSAEVAMGEYTKQFEKGAAEAFSECHTDFCEQLALYLKGQMSRIDYDESSQDILKAFSKLNQIVQSFPTQERNVLNTLYGFCSECPDMSPDDISARIRMSCGFIVPRGKRPRENLGELAFQYEAKSQT